MKKLILITLALVFFVAGPATGAGLLMNNDQHPNGTWFFQHATGVNAKGVVQGADITATDDVVAGDDGLIGDDLDVVDAVRAARTYVDVVTTPTDFVNAPLDTVLTTADRGKYFTNLGATTTATFNLPTESVAGAAYFFIVKEPFSVQVNPKNAQIIIGLTNATGDEIQNTGTSGDSIEMIYVGGNVWVQGRIRGTWGDNN